MADSASKVARYTSFLRTKLEPDLIAARDALRTIEIDLSEYEQLAAQLDTMVERSAKGEKRMETMLELGFGVFAEAVIPDFSNITLDLGLGVHAELPVSEAAAYVTRRREVLNKKLDVAKNREGMVLEQIEAVHGALAELTTQ